MRVQRHLYFVQHMVPAQTIVSARQIAVDILAATSGSACVISAGMRSDPDTSVRDAGAKSETVRCEMRTERGGQCARFIRCRFQRAAVGQY